MTATESMHDPAEAPAARPMVWFGPDPGWRLVDLGEMWRSRELLFVLAGRDLRVRYRQAIIGVLWVLLQPLAMLLIFQAFFTLLGSDPSTSDVPYALSAFTGLLVWQLLANTVQDATAVLVGHREMLTKIYFPRLFLPMSTVLVALVDFAVAFTLLVPLMWWAGVSPGWPILLLPVLLLWAATLALGCGAWLSALNALYRDVGHAVPFLLRLGFFVSPVMYETSIVPERYQWLYRLNPAATLIESFRWSVFGADPPPAPQLIAGLAVTLAVLLSGLAYFRRVERWIVDRV